ncbi:IclR family transcriptional regulator [Nocardia sp. XZ_19_369]|uniref:IclR family transcriptional regulator n=1 Tax=Nocardia sp. XZ_19_369 TaxID=2769487 RepID=UPI00188DD610|nr:IclR family transcriptional regulator C-terminal domain-containing protein [Nocardia sp. XZ_19_369]
MLDRVAAILDVAALARAPIGLTELAVRVQAPVSSTQSLVNGLVAIGYLVEEDRRYTLGPAPFVLALRAGHRPLETVRHSDLTALHRATGLAAVTAIRVGDCAVYIDAVLGDGPGTGPLAYTARRYLRLPLHELAAGRLLLAHLPEDERLEYLAGHQGDQPRAVLELSNELDNIRRDGYLIGPHGPLFPDTDAVVAPISEHGRVVATISLIGPQEIIDRHRDTLPALLIDAVHRWAERDAATTAPTSTEDI